jgi:hypothetical protein
MAIISETLWSRYPYQDPLSLSTIRASVLSKQVKCDNLGISSVDSGIPVFTSAYSRDSNFEVPRPNQDNAEPQNSQSFKP